MHTLGFIQNIGWTEMIVLLVIALLLFGRRLPEVGRSLGKGIVEFKRGLNDIKDEVETQAQQPATPAYRAPISEGQDPRVARGQSVDAPASAPTNPQ